jgi:hypothetical protein
MGFAKTFINYPGYFKDIFAYTLFISITLFIGSSEPNSLSAVDFFNTTE